MDYQLDNQPKFTIAQDAPTSLCDLDLANFMDSNFLDNLDNTNPAFNNELFLTTPEDIGWSPNPQQYLTPPTDPRICLGELNPQIRSRSDQVMLADNTTSNGELKELLLRATGQIERLEKEIDSLKRQNMKQYEMFHDFSDTLNKKIEDMDKSFKLFGRRLVNYIIGFHVEGDLDENSDL